MERFIIFLLSSLYLSIASSLTIQQGEQQPSVFTASPLLNGDMRPGDGRIDSLNRLNYPLSDAFEIRRRIWNKVQRCEICHSLDVVFSNSYIPILQGQNREYLYSKIKLFRENPLSRHPFPNFSQSLSQDEIIDISLYYSIQNSLLDLKLVQIDSQWRDEQKELGTSIQPCLDCHGNDGNGAGLIPDLSGQSKNYLSYRIREISSDSSKIHIHSDAQVSCAIAKVNIEQSRWLANKLSLVVDSTRLSRGEAVYGNHCQSCHEKGDSGAPVLSVQVDWMKKLQSGINQYADYAARYKHRQLEDLKHRVLSRNQWSDAVHYVVSQAAVVDNKSTD